ncbi:MAG: polysaccharide biosynthesis tyrosine autokinase [Phycisphaerales bacterium]|nr:polysaccharide biosynthesis tyrosine autokinase [Phycisphaerales bacterium]
MTTIPTTAGPRTSPGPKPRPALGQQPARGKAPAISLDPIRVVRQHIKLLIATSVVGVGLGVVIHIICLLYFPLYTAFALYECQSITTSVLADEQMTPGLLEELEKFMKTQAYAMTADNILATAVNSPDIKTDTEWAKQYRDADDYNRIEAQLDLAEDIRCGPIPETFFLKLILKGPIPDDLPIIVNTIGDVYLRELSNRNRIENSATQELIAGERANLLRRQESIEAAMADFLSTHDISVLETRLSAEAIEQQAIQAQLQQTSAQLEQIQQMLKQYEAAFAVEGAIAYPDSIKLEAQEHPRIAALQNQVVQLRAALRTAREQFGNNHRDVKALERQIRALEQEIEAEVQRLMESIMLARIDQSRQAATMYTEMMTKLTIDMTAAADKMRDLTNNLKKYERWELELATIREQTDEIEAQIRRMNLTGQSQAAQRVQRYARATKPEEVTFPRITTMVPGVTILFVGLVTGIIFLREIIDQRVKSPADIGALAHGKILGVIPEIAEDPGAPDSFDLIVRSQPQAVIAESFRQLRTPLIKNMMSRGHKVVVMISAAPGSGGTSVIGNLAASCAAEERRVLVIDCNYRRPQLLEHFGIENGPGIADALAGGAEFTDVIRPTDIDNLSLIGAGSTEYRVIEHLGSAKFRAMLDEARARFDLILLDSAPSIVAGDSQVLANQTDASVLITRAMRDKRGLVARVVQQLDDCKSEFLGVIINGVRSSAGGYYRKNIQAMDAYHRSGTEA